MTVRITSILAVLLLVAVIGRVEAEEKDTREEDARKDLQLMQGTWQLDSHESNDKAKVDIKNRTLFIGSELYLVRDGNKVVQVGTLRLSLGRTPKRVDVVVRKGLHADNTMLGIYEVKGDTLKICIDPEGEGRPSKFVAKTETSQFVAVYKRVKPSDEKIEIAGKYKSVSDGPDGKKQTMLAEIQKRGDAYLVRWLTEEGNLAYVGTGIRQGDVLSVAWVNRGSVGISVYKIAKGPKLTGQYTDVGGPGLLPRETLTAADRDITEVRKR